MTEYHQKIKMFREMRNFTQEHMADVFKNYLKEHTAQLKTDKLSLQWKDCLKYQVH